MLERARGEAEVGVGAALLALDDAGVQQLLEVIADGGLLEIEHRLEVAHADRVAVRREQAVEDLHAVAVGERLEDGLELLGLGIGERRLRERGTALDKR